MGIHAKQEWNEQVVRIPESLEGLSSYTVMSRGVHQKHAQKHDMSSDAACLGVVYLYRSFWSKLVLLDVEEVDVVSRYVDNSEEQYCIGDLPVEPLSFIQWKPSDVRA